MSEVEEKKRVGVKLKLPTLTSLSSSISVMKYLLFWNSTAINFRLLVNRGLRSRRRVTEKSSSMLL